MIASKPDKTSATRVAGNWLETVCAAQLAGARRQQQIARAIAEAGASAAEDYAGHLRRLGMATDPMTAWACHEAWLRGSWQRAADRAGIVTSALK
ncbi:hypothetical protein [Falsirhodobacter xinxiangensis]|uniref:hypothetical protein n=1 Tax=Falsirhodobacter xinxiangensis TaxID=2530049 RepID=UPI0010AA66C2|nr:hypothetical protein [Rhodobacter xinxiangensis]